MSAVRTVALALACILVALTAGLWLGGHPESLPDPLRDAFVEDDRALRAEVIDAIEQDFFKDVDEDELRDRSLKAIVESLDDRFSNYLTPEEAEEFNASVDGEFEGVGMAVEEDKRGLKVVNLFPGSPAKRAGIKRGELITAVNGRSIAGVSSQVATGRIKGPPDTEVTLEVVDPDSDDPRELTIERERIQVPVVRGRLVARGGADIAHVRLFSFTRGAHGVLRQEIDELVKRGADGILLDLRGNGGGLLQEAVLVASVFIEDGEITSTRGRAKPEREFEAQGDAIDADLPVAVLVDGGSASASEIVTGALRDRKRALVIGTRTFGKGVFQEVQSLSNGGVLDLTVGRYYLPSGEGISDKGIKPAIRARDNPDTERDEALPRALDELARRLG